MFDGETDAERTEGEEEEEANGQRGGSKDAVGEGEGRREDGELGSGDVQLEGLPGLEVENIEQEQVSELETSFVCVSVV